MFLTIIRVVPADRGLVGFVAFESRGRVGVCNPAAAGSKSRCWVFGSGARQAGSQAGGRADGRGRAGRSAGRQAQPWCIPCTVFCNCTDCTRACTHARTVIRRDSLCRLMPTPRMSCGLGSLAPMPSSCSPASLTARRAPTLTAGAPDPTSTRSHPHSTRPVRWISIRMSTAWLYLLLSSSSSSLLLSQAESY